MPTEAEIRRLIVQSARNARRVYRQADTAGESVERWLDRMIERKTRITSDQAMPLVNLWEDWRNKVRACELAFADFISMAGF